MRDVSEIFSTEETHLLYLDQTRRSRDRSLAPSIRWGLNVQGSKSRARPIPVAARHGAHRSSNHRALITQKCCCLNCFALSRVPPHSGFTIPVVLVSLRGKVTGSWTGRGSNKGALYPEPDQSHVLYQNYHERLDLFFSVRLFLTGPRNPVEQPFVRWNVLVRAGPMLTVRCPNSRLIKTDQRRLRCRLPSSSRLFDSAEWDVYGDHAGLQELWYNYWRLCKQAAPNILTLEK